MEEDFEFFYIARIMAERGHYGHRREQVRREQRRDSVKLLREWFCRRLH